MANALEKLLPEYKAVRETMLRYAESCRKTAMYFLQIAEECENNSADMQAKINLLTNHDYFEKRVAKFSRTNKCTATGPLWQPKPSKINNPFQSISFSNKSNIKLTKNFFGGRLPKE